MWHLCWQSAGLSMEATADQVFKACVKNRNHFSRSACCITNIVDVWAHTIKIDLSFSYHTENDGQFMFPGCHSPVFYLFIYLFIYLFSFIIKKIIVQHPNIQYRTIVRTLTFLSCIKEIYICTEATIIPTASYQLTRHSMWFVWLLWSEAKFNLIYAFKWCESLDSASVDAKDNKFENEMNL